VVLKGIFNGIVSSNDRAYLNVAQSSLEFGTLGSIIFLQSFIMIINNMRFKKLAWIAFLLGLYAVGIAASRGPAVSLIIALFCYFSMRNIGKSIIMLLGFTLLLFFFGNVIFDWSSTLFPTLLNRMVLTVNEFDTGGRDVIFGQAINQFMNNPFFGDWFLLDRGDMTSSPHNAIVEAFSSLGIFGGILIIALYIILIIKVFKILKYNSYLSFYASLCLFLISYSITTGGSLITKLNFNFAFLVILILDEKFYAINKYESEK
jgi:O-antigen ligase